MVALGASSVQAAGDAVSSPEPVKPWSVSATLRGFYDDNINSTPTKQDAFGYEVSPSLLWKQTWEQTSLSLGYTYAFLYYDHAPANNANKYDQDHTFNADFKHRFSERYSLGVSDGFVVGQEPDTLRSGVAFNTFQRVSGDNYRNAGAINFDAQLTRLFGVELGYANAFYKYNNNNPTVDPVTDQVTASTAGLLDRIENAVHLDGRWLLQPQTTGILGYQFRDINYTADEIIAGKYESNVPNPDANATSDSRNARMHYGYIGADHNFRPDLTGSIRAGASYADYYNDPNQSAQVSPYGQISLRYTYAQESYLEAGASYDRIATDLVGAQQTGTQFTFTTDAQAAVIYATWNHRITPRLFGSITGQFQNDLYNNGAFNNETEQFYLLGLNLEYRFTRNFSAHVGYNFDDLQSSITNPDRSFSRNRVYMGLAASY
jgi:hypothetical protein